MSTFSNTRLGLLELTSAVPALDSWLNAAGYTTLYYALSVNALGDGRDRITCDFSALVVLENNTVHRFEAHRWSLWLKSSSCRYDGLLRPQSQLVYPGMCPFMGIYSLIDLL